MTLKNKDLDEIISHYHFINHLIAALILTVIYFFFRYYIDTYLLSSIADQQISNAARVILAILLILLWSASVFYDIREILYHDKTGGRSYEYDHSQYRRSYAELVDYFKDADKYQLKAEDLPVEDWHSARGLIIGQTTSEENSDEHRLLKISQDTGNGTNLLNLGLPGSGKSMAQIIPSGERAKGSVLCWDLKGDILNWTLPVREKMGQKVKLFCPANANMSCHYNPFDGVNQLSTNDRRVFVEQMALTLIPDASDDAGKYFTEGARDYFCGICQYFLDQDIHTTFPAIIRAILDGDVFEWTMKIKESGIRAASDYTNGYVGSNEKNVSGIWSALCRAVRPLSTGSLAEILSDGDDMISPSDLNDGKTDIYILIPPQTVGVYAAISSLLIAQCMDFFLSRDDRGTSDHSPSPITFLLDEVCQTTISAKTLANFMALGRSKNCSCFLTAQSVMMIRQHFGDYADQILDLCQIISCFSAQSPDSTQWLSKLFGQKKVLKKANTQTSSQYASSSRSAQEAMEPVLRPEDFQNLGGKVAVLYYGKHIILDRTNVYE